MDEEQVERRLITIIAANVVVYTYHEIMHRWVWASLIQN
jgi:hypothetical protein